MINDPKVKIVELVNQYVQELKLDCFLVGGYLRDQLLGLTSQDLDLSVSHNLEMLVKKLANHLNSEYFYYSNFRTATIKLNPQQREVFAIQSLDFCEFRSENYPATGKLPEISSGNFESDIRRRDFTINTLAISLSDYVRLAVVPDYLIELKKSLIDDLQGLSDLENKLIRILHPDSFLDDPTRIFRAVRYKVLLNGDFQLETREKLLQAIKAQALQTIDSYRIANELTIMLNFSECSKMIIELIDLEVFSSIFNTWPENTQLLKEQISKLNYTAKLDDDLISFLTPIVDYFGISNIKNLGFKNKYIQQIKLRISDVNN